MNENEVYELMDWASIEALVYSEHDNPHEILGAHATERGILIGAYVPEAQEITVITEKGGEYPMLCEDEAGYFAALLDGKRIPQYRLRAKHRDGSVEEYTDPYSFAPVISEKDCELFSKGIHYTVYEKLGAHILKQNGTEGTLFAVWAPNAMRVSVVGNFNQWDGRRHQMRRLGDSGIFELFIPGIGKGEIYKYELKARGGLTYLKADPYANAAELRPANASVVAQLDSFSWSDAAWMDARKRRNYDEEPMSIYEVHLGSFRKPEEKNGSFYNYREIAVMLADYVGKMGYTHIELMPVMEHPFDGSWGYQVTGYYAVTSRYGTPEDFMYFMNYMHERGIGVILDWVPAHFPRDTFGLSNFDGTCLYEHADPRQGSHPHWGTLIYNYARPQVSNFLIANALFWVEKYHADGIRMDAVASMLYLDYGKGYGEWVANKYGGHENLDAIELFHHLNSVFHKRKDGAMLIAEESTAWPEVTGDVENGGLGFDFKWNMGWMNDFTNYMKQDPLFRKGSHGALTFSMMYAYSEKFILVLSHDEVVHGKASMLYKMPGTIQEKFSNLRLAYGFMTAHPGKKLLFMGQEFGQTREWSEERSLDWNLLEFEEHRQMQEYSAKLNELYRKHPALHQLDYDPDGFEWMSCMDADHSIVSFVRRSKKQEEILYVICNFTPVIYENYKAAVPFAGKYKEIFSSDAEEFGGSGRVNPRAKTAKEGEVDGRENYIEITLPPLGIAVFSAVKDESKKSAGKGSAKEVAPKKAGRKAASAKTAAVKEAEAAKPEAVKKAAAKTAPKAAAKQEPAAETVVEKPAENAAAAAETAPKAVAKREPAEETVVEKPAEKAAAAAETAPKAVAKREPAEETVVEKPSDKAAAAETAPKAAAKQEPAAETVVEKPSDKAASGKKAPETGSKKKTAKASADSGKTGKKPANKKSASKTGRAKKSEK